MNSDPLFAPLEPFREHRLPVGQGHVLHVEECGRPDGLPVLFLHGGPGSGCSPNHRRFFAPDRFRAILVDQRGCGRSTPQGNLRANTTAHLVCDLEAIRSALGIERWLVFGGSWGSLLALAYAQAHPGALLGLVLRGIFLGSPEELCNYAQGVGTPVPAAWERFAAAMPPGERQDLLTAYTRRLRFGRPSLRGATARHWLDYERALMGEPPLPSNPDPVRLAKARIQAHYLSRHCFTDRDGLLAACGKLGHLPAIIVQGGQDPVCPPAAALALHRAWPGSELVLVEQGGHSALAPALAAACIDALRRLADRCRPGQRMA